MNVYFGSILVWIMAFPSLFSWVAPFVYIGFIWTLITRPKAIKTAVNHQLVIGFFIFIALGFILILLNILLFNDYSTWTYWIAGYSTWFIFLILFRTINTPANTVHNAIVVAGFIAGLGNILYISLFLSGLSKDPISFPGYEAYFGIDDRGFFAFSTSHLPLIGFLVPYFTYKASNTVDGLKNKEKLLMFILVVTGVLSLRTAIWIVIFASLLYFCLKTKNIMFLVKISAALFVTLIFIAIYFGFDYESISGIYELKLSAKISGDDVRYKQLVFWIKSFFAAPLFGHGLTSVETTIYNMATGELILDRPGPIVSDYGYEIFYGKMLSDIGSIFFIYIIIFYWLTFNASTASSLQWQVKALRFAALFMLFQSCTNSYLQTSGWLFVLMLPIIFIKSNKNLFSYYGKGESIQC